MRLGVDWAADTVEVRLAAAESLLAILLHECACRAPDFYDVAAINLLTMATGADSDHARRIYLRQAKLIEAVLAKLKPATLDAGAAMQNGAHP